MKILVISFYILLLLICISYIIIPIRNHSDFLKLAICLPIGGMIYHAIEEIKEWWKL